MNKLVFQKKDTIGSVIYVDTNQVLIEVEDNEKISLLNIIRPFFRERFLKN